jgi:hypothetical protein
LFKTGIVDPKTAHRVSGWFENTREKHRAAVRKVNGEAKRKKSCGILQKVLTKNKAFAIFLIKAPSAVCGV